MKKKSILLLLLFLFSNVLPCFANIDPILLDEPNENVFGCKNDIFIELMEKPAIGKNTSGRNAVNNYMYFKTKVLFLAEAKWPALDKDSFSLIYVNEEGKERTLSAGLRDYHVEQHEKWLEYLIRPTFFHFTLHHQSRF